MLVSREVLISKEVDGIQVSVGVVCSIREVSSSFPGGSDTQGA